MKCTSAPASASASASPSEGYAPVSSAITTRRPSEDASSRARASAPRVPGRCPSPAPGIEARSGRRELAPSASQSAPVATTTASGCAAISSSLVGSLREAQLPARALETPRRDRPPPATSARASAARPGRARWPPGSGSRSCTMTSWPRAAAVAAVRSPAGPAPITITLPGRLGLQQRAVPQRLPRARWRA